MLLGTGHPSAVKIQETNTWVLCSMNSTPVVGTGFLLLKMRCGPVGTGLSFMLHDKIDTEHACQNW